MGTILGPVLLNNGIVLVPGSSLVLAPSRGGTDIIGAGAYPFHVEETPLEIMEKVGRSDMGRAVDLEAALLKLVRWTVREDHGEWEAQCLTRDEENPALFDSEQEAIDATLDDLGVLRAKV